MTWLVLLFAAALSAVAAAAVLYPFGRGAAMRLEPAADPLQDERAGLLRSLRELDDERAGGMLDEDDYRMLRRDTERRAVAVLRTIEARGLAEPGASVKDVAPAPAPANGHAPSVSRRRPTLPALIVAAAVALVATPLLLHAVAARQAGQAITGDTAGTSGPPLSLFEQRVRQHPNDVAARLDLAERYGNAGLDGLAVTQYSAALRLDPRNAEAHSGLALILYQQGHLPDALAAANQALSVDAAYPEALYVRGLSLVALHRPAQAAVALRAYLSAAPFGSHRAEVQQVLAGLPTT